MAVLWSIGGIFCLISKWNLNTIFLLLWKHGVSRKLCQKLLMGKKISSYSNCPKFNLAIPNKTELLGQFVSKAWGERNDFGLNNDQENAFFKKLFSFALIL